MSNQVIVVGGGLAGATAANTILEHGGTVLLLDKSPFLGGNSTKATSGINGTPTQAQIKANVRDSVELFIKDMTVSYHGGKEGPTTPIVKALGELSGESIEWLSRHFGLDLSVVGLMAGHSTPRTHRGKERFPGMTITMGLLDALEREAAAPTPRIRILTKARVVRLLREGDGSGAVGGVVYVTQDGKEHTAEGPVILCTGGYAADFTPSSLIAKYRPDLMGFATTNGTHCTGDGLKLANEVGGALVDMSYVQVHPTGFVDPKDPNNKVKFLAAEALRGSGALILNGEGRRFVNELARRKDVSEAMAAAKGPFWLVLNSAASNPILWHCKHYTGRGLMRHFSSGDEMARGIGVSPKSLASTFEGYNATAATKRDAFGKTTFPATPFSMKDAYYVAQITPVVHYTMGGVAVNARTEVLDAQGAPIVGLYSAGECAGGVHGVNRLGGNSLLDCVAFGRVAGQEACRLLLQRGATRRLEVIASQLKAAPTTATSTTTATAAAAPPPPPPPVKSPSAPTTLRKITPAEVAKHNTEADCWIIVGNRVLNVTTFMADHPGGKHAIMLFAGKDATAEYDMLHKRDMIDKHAAHCVIGEVA